MSRAAHFVRVTVLLLAGAAGAGAVPAAGKPATEPARKTGEAVAPAKPAPATPTHDSPPAAKAARPAAQAIVSNPYDVPLLKNAGSLPVPR